MKEIVKHKKVLIFGGTFSPPTKAHSGLINKAISLEKYDEIWVMPCRDRTDKKASSNETDRLNMVKRLVQDEFPDKNVIVSDFEYNLPQPTMTYLTHKALIRNFPNIEFTHFIGEDSLITMPNWEFGEELLKELNWLIAPRGSDKPRIYPLNYSYIVYEDTGLSSTKVRNMIKISKPINNLVNKSVLEYIERRKLYV